MTNGQFFILMLFLGGLMGGVCTWLYTIRGTLLDILLELKKQNNFK